MKRVLVVDDDPAIRKVVREALSREGFEVETAADGREAIEKAEAAPFDLVITDLSMPNVDGHGLVREMRKNSDVPILVLTVRAEEKAKVALLDAGADDYVVKPFGVAELLARVRALLRRQAPAVAGPLRFGDVEVDLAGKRVLRGGREIHLTPTEFALLETFLSKPGALWTHRQLIAAVWEGGEGVTNDTVRVHVGSLRRKIEPDPNRPRRIVTEPWVGYRFNPGE
ncbi:MAG TPA: response regulator transcription factor [Thermoanaerobaculia bacterium]|nr:response regulator transcription factor [Thermoanaerobaculia bacterium]